MFEEGLQALRDLEQLSIKYQAYKRATPSKIVFRDVQNDMEREIASKVSNRLNIFTGFGAVVFIITTIALFSLGDIGEGILCGLATALLLYFFLTALLSKHKVAYGVAVWKHYRMEDIAREGSKTFFLSVIFEQPEKIIVRDIQTTRADYDRIVEGTPVMIIKKGNLYQARLYGAEMPSSGFITNLR